ncbi:MULTISPECIES: hypothetical protein [unclassified Bradyrhizobium]|uniref:hypothetical protein n=1 Tax=unclassified Bradyrhizobium TaxID=2631580 RepID=UPI0028E2DAEE|nr:MULTISPECIES: hypothetical protein [unclassified Bradyrhizobium]
MGRLRLPMLMANVAIRQPLPIGDRGLELGDACVRPRHRLSAAAMREGGRGGIEHPGTTAPPVATVCLLFD